MGPPDRRWTSLRYNRKLKRGVEIKSGHTVSSSNYEEELMEPRKSSFVSDEEMDVIKPKVQKKSSSHVIEYSNNSSYSKPSSS